MNNTKHLVLLLLIFHMGAMVSIAQTHGLKTVEIEGETAIDEAAIENLAYQVLNTEKDEERLTASEELKAVLQNELSKENAFTFPFDQVKSMVILTPNDSVFRLFNWNIPLNDGTYLYECGILKRAKSSQGTLLFLTPRETDSLSPEQVSTINNEWFPALYYDIIEKNTDLQHYYTLLAWDGNNRLSSKKSIDVLWFDPSEEVRFGAPIFEKNGKKQNRVLFEFSSQESMKMNFNAENDQIQFDLLVPIRSDYEGIYEYYFPAVTQDAYQWKKNRWVFQALINPDEGKRSDQKKFEKEIKKEKKEMLKNQEIIYSPK